MSIATLTGTLTPLQYGLTVNLITKQVNSDIVYEGLNLLLDQTIKRPCNACICIACLSVTLAAGGRHLIGPWKSFLAFPSTRVTVRLGCASFVWACDGICLDHSRRQNQTIR